MTSFITFTDNLDYNFRNLRALLLSAWHNECLNNFNVFLDKKQYETYNFQEYDFLKELLDKTHIEFIDFDFIKETYSSHLREYSLRWNDLSYILSKMYILFMIDREDFIYVDTDCILNTNLAEIYQYFVNKQLYFILASHYHSKNLKVHLPGSDLSYPIKHMNSGIIFMDHRYGADSRKNIFEEYLLRLPDLMEYVLVYSSRHTHLLEELYCSVLFQHELIHRNLTYKDVIMDPFIWAEHEFIKCRLDKSMIVHFAGYEKTLSYYEKTEKNLLNQYKTQKKECIFPYSPMNFKLL